MSDSAGTLSDRTGLLVDQLTLIYGVCIQHNVIVYGKSVVGALFDGIIFIIGLDNLDLLKYGIPFVNIVNALQGCALSNLRIAAERHHSFLYNSTHHSHNKW